MAYLKEKRLSHIFSQKQKPIGRKTLRTQTRQDPPWHQFPPPCRGRQPTQEGSLKIMNGSCRSYFTNTKGSGEEIQTTTMSVGLPDITLVIVGADVLLPWWRWWVLWLLVMIIIDMFFLFLFAILLCSCLCSCSRRCCRHHYFRLCRKQCWI